MRFDVETARGIALEAHQGQKYGDLPYAVHVLDVAAMLAPLGPRFQALAYVHDVLEDTDYEFPPLNFFTDAEWASVDAITRREGERYFDYVRRCKQDFVARVVKIADIRYHLDPSRVDAISESQQERYRKALVILEGDWEPTDQGRES